MILRGVKNPAGFGVKYFGTPFFANYIEQICFVKTENSLTYSKTFVSSETHNTVLFNFIFQPIVAKYIMDSKKKTKY